MTEPIVTTTIESEETKPRGVQGTIREVLIVSIPLILSMSGHSLKMFFDRVMLSHYSAEAMNATISAGLLCFTFQAFFIGTAGYANTFVAQYTGAEKKKHVGSAVWQGIFLGLIGSLILTILGLFSQPVFINIVKHEKTVAAQEAIYFSVCCFMSVFTLLKLAFSCYWSGMGKTKIIAIVALSSSALNIALNYPLIFGLGPIPAMGIFGAALATGISEAAALTVYVILFLQKKNRERHNTLPKHLFNWNIFSRLLKYGVPFGINFMLDIAAFTVFVFIMGWVGDNMVGVLGSTQAEARRLAQEASTIAFSINAVIFLPIIGMGQGISVLVGQAIGAQDIAGAKRVTASGLKINLIYASFASVFMLFTPAYFTSLFARSHDDAQHLALELVGTLMYFVSAWTIFDGILITFSSAIRGAGDTFFAMWAGIVMSWFVMALPSYILYTKGYGIWTIWTMIIINISVSSLIFYLRYREGKWQHKSVIELH